LFPRRELGEADHRGRRSRRRRRRRRRRHSAFPGSFVSS